MVTVPFTIADLPGYFPHVNARRYESPIILDGRNFAWDAAGPYSAFSSRFLVDSTSVESAPNVTQSLEFSSRTYIATIDHLRYIDSNGDWATLHTFSAIPNPYALGLNEIRWTSLFLGGKEYVCHPIRGIFRIDAGPTLTDISGITGMPADVIAIGETSGRAIYLNATTVSWSGGNDAEDLTPALGGAGFQVLGARVPGAPFALTTFSDGFIVWTDKGALYAEFIGGDNVFRFDRMRMKMRPLNAFAIQEISDGSFALASRKGVFRLMQDASLKEIDPQFNLFFQQQWRTLNLSNPVLFYSQDEDHLYVSLRDTTAVFNHTYVLHTTLGKWGRFSTPHLGIYDYSVERDRIAYTDANGVVHRLLSPVYRDGSRDSAGGRVGLDSYIEVGYIRPPNVVSVADMLTELYTIQVYRPPGAKVVEVDEGFVNSGIEIITDEGLVTDSVVYVFDESPELLFASNVSYELSVIGDNFSNYHSNSYVTMPALAVVTAEADIWTCIAGANFFRIGFSAVEEGQYFHLTTMELTMATLGQQV